LPVEKSTNTELLKPIRNRLLADDATEAIKGIALPLESELAQKLQALEKLREVAKLEAEKGRKTIDRYSDEIRILRAEVALLALEYSALMNRKDFERVEADNAKQYFATVGSLLEVAKFQEWFRQKYNSEWINKGEMKLLEVIKKVMERV
jgi:hypothetical protein